MGPARLLGLCLVLSALSWAAHENLTICNDCPSAFCLNDTHCGCKSGYRPPAWRRDILDSCDDINECLEQPQPCGPHETCSNFPGTFNCSCDQGYRPAPPTGDPPTTTPPDTPPRPASHNCVDVDECAEVGKERCGGGKICFNTPGSFECHCPPGYADTPDGNCTAVTVPPPLCSDDQSHCGLAEALTHLYGLLRGGGRPPPHPAGAVGHPGRGVWGGGGGCPQASPLGHHAAGGHRGAGEGGGGPPAPPPPSPPSPPMPQSCAWPCTRVPPPGPVRLQVPGVQLDVPEEVAWDSDTGRALVALLSQQGLGQVLEGAPKVQWGGWGDLPPPPAGARPSYHLLSPVATAFVTRPRPPGASEVTLRFQHPPPDPQLGARVLCAFWDPQEKVWATAGCREVTPHPGTPPGPPGTTCACNHLTSFAVLMAFHELEDDWVLDLVTKVGLGVSVVSLVVAAATFLLCRALKGLRTTLHLHLSLSLLLAHSTFLLGIDRTQHPTACAVVAGVLHFSFLAAFCWMCPGGAAPLRAPRASLRALVATRATPPPGRLRAARPPGHHRRRRLPRGLRDPPLLNAVVLVVTVWKLVQKFNDVNPDMGHLRKMRVLAATAAGQLCLLGTGWALGLGLGGGLPRPGGPLSPLPLLFCALNAAQGLFILLCHCLAHPQLRDAYRACLCPGTKRYSEFTSATSNTSNTRISRNSDGTRSRAKSSHEDWGGGHPQIPPPGSLQRVHLLQLPPPHGCPGGGFYLCDY
ncbi:adhesion G protein-coupled receptor E5-like [Aquila chrysaetos chrysaetos]|uniref:adhesion G protein-coupled receptor E5-like n=1 Tax=Aquila chrysaetos chrysaetos TaxID=223781 RepID=UPI001176B517|nr:adhesion G protein-coupled receptor E5-like [Aquila chrysaetos chrysaetos]